MGTRVHRFLKHSELNAIPDRTRVYHKSQEKAIYTTRNTPSIRNTDTAKSKLRVRFVLPEEETVDRKEIEVFPDPSELPGSSSLPAICEFMIFSPKMNHNRAKQKTTLAKKPAIVRQTTEDSTNKQRESSNMKLPPTAPKYSKQEMKIDSNCMMPEDYKNPTQVDTRRRILAWLNDAEKAKPAYRRRMDASNI